MADLRQVIDHHNAGGVDNVCIEITCQDTCQVPATNSSCTGLQDMPASSETCTVQCPRGKLLGCHSNNTPFRDLPLPPPIHPLPTPWFAPNLTSPPPGLHMPCQIKLHGMPFNSAEGRLLFLHTPYIPKPTPCCKLGGKSLPFIHFVGFLHQVTQEETHQC